MFGVYWSTTYFVSLHPMYMASILHYSMSENGVLSSLPYLSTVLGALVSSVGSIWITNRKLLSVDTVRKSCSSLSGVGFCTCLLGVILAGCDRTTTNLCFGFSQFFIGIGISGSMIVCGDMCPTFAGTLMSLSSTLASSAAVIFPVISGAMIKHGTLEEWHWVFYMNMAVILSAAFLFHAFGSAKVQPWDTPQTASVAEKLMVSKKDSQTELPVRDLLVAQMNPRV